MIEEEVEILDVPGKKVVYLEGPADDCYQFAYPFPVSIVEDAQEWIVYEERHAIHSWAPTQEKAIEGFKAVIASELVWLSEHEQMLHLRLLEQLAYLREALKKEVLSYNDLLCSGSSPGDLH